MVFIYEFGKRFGLTVKQAFNYLTSPVAYAGSPYFFRTAPYPTSLQTIIPASIHTDRPLRTGELTFHLSAFLTDEGFLRLANRLTINHLRFFSIKIF